jgi:hypothetical protein
MNLRNLLKRFVSPKRVAVAMTRRRARPWLERLEDRTVPTLAWYATPADPFWSTPGNWVDTLDPYHQPAGPPGGQDLIFDSFYSTAGSVVDGRYTAGSVNWNGASDGNILVIPFPPGNPSNISTNNYFNHWGTLWVFPGATVRAQGDFSLTNGTIKSSAGMTISIGGTFADAGLIIATGPLTINCGAFVQEATAPIDVPGAMLIHAQTSITLNGPITGGGVLILEAPVVNIYGSITLTRTDPTMPPGLLSPGPDALTVGTWINEHGFLGSIGDSPTPPPGSLSIPAAVAIANGGGVGEFYPETGTIPPRTLEILSADPNIEPFASVTVENGFMHVSSELDHKGTITLKNPAAVFGGDVEMVGATLTSTHEGNGAWPQVAIHGSVSIDPSSAVSVGDTGVQIDGDVIMHGGSLDIGYIQIGSMATVNGSIETWSPARVTVTESTVIVRVDFDMVNEPLPEDHCILTVNNDSQTPIVQEIGLPGQTGIVVVGNFEMPPDTTINLSGGQVSVGGSATQNGGTVRAISDTHDEARISTGGAYLEYRRGWRSPRCTGVCACKLVGGSTGCLR